MSLKASALKDNKSQISAISMEVNNILSHIDDELKTAHESNRHSVKIAVPINFGIPYMKNSDAQRKIYYRILTSLIDREYHVKIHFGDTSVIFHITWLSDDEIKEIDLENALLAKHTYKDPNSNLKNRLKNEVL